MREFQDMCDSEKLDVLGDQYNKLKVYKWICIIFIILAIINLVSIIFSEVTLDYEGLIINILCLIISIIVRYVLRIKQLRIVKELYIIDKRDGYI